MVKVKLPKKTKGEELVQIIQDSLDYIGYDASVETLDEHYVPGSVKLKENKKNVYGNIKEPKPFSLGEKIFFNIPLFGWVGYFCEKRDPNSTYFFQKRSIGITLECDREYDSVEFRTQGYEMNASELKDHPQLKKEFEKLVGFIYEKLSYQPSPATS